MSDVKETEVDRMWKAITAWTKLLQEYPGFREWNRKKIGAALWFEDPFEIPKEGEVREFKFSDDVEKQHALVMKYLYLLQVSHGLKDCEYYFRRYPFRGLPVSRYQHITNVCEMYFSRFYEFKTRLKNYFEALKCVNPNHGLDIGKFIKEYDKVFGSEVRERNSVHHHERFSDIAIDRLFVTDALSIAPPDKGWKDEHLRAYNKVTREWVKRVKRRAAVLDQFVEAIAQATLSTCPFLSASLFLPTPDSRL